MSATLAAPHWGRGVVLAAPDQNRGSVGTGGPLAAEGADIDAGVLAGLSAKEAIDSLVLDNAAVNMPSIETSDFPGPIAEAFYWCDDAIVGIQGPVGSGKTTTLLKSRLRRAVMMPRSSIDGVRRYKLLAVRKTYRELWSTTIPSYLETFPKAYGQWSGGRGDPVTHFIRFEDAHGPIEFTVEFMAFGDDVIAAMRGIQTTDMWLNEADTCPSDVIAIGMGRTNRWPGRAHFAGLPDRLQTYAQMVCDFNAPDEDNWTFKVFHDEAEQKKQFALLAKYLDEGAAPISIRFFNQPGYGEPGCENLQNLAKGYYQTQIALNRLAGKGDLNERLVFNKVVYLRAGDPVFSREFSKRIHVAAETMDLIPGVPLRLGFDQGFKGAAVLAQFVTPFHWRIYAELHFPQERLMAHVFGLRLAALLQSERFRQFRVEAAWGDMAGEHGASQAAEDNANWNLMVSKAAEITIRPQRIGTNRLGPRLEAIRAALEYIEAGQPGLLIDPCCKFLIRGLEARYVWREVVDANGDKRKEPDKSFTEANVVDATQYLLLSEVLGDGRNPNSFPDELRRRRHNGGPPLRDKPGGLTTTHDILNPYGASP
jgi:hypothetical protein